MRLKPSDSCWNLSSLPMIVHPLRTKFSCGFCLCPHCHHVKVIFSLARYRMIFALAQLTPPTATDLSAPVIGGKRGTKANAPLSETALAAKQRFTRALKFVGPGLADLLIDVWCHLTGLEEAERAKGRPQRWGKIVLQIALDRQARHSGMTPAAGQFSRRIHGWHAPDEEKMPDGRRGGDPANRQADRRELAISMRRPRVHARVSVPRSPP